MLLVLICVFQIEGSPSPQFSFDLQQLGKPHLWGELKYFSFLSAWSLQKMDSWVPSSLNRQMGKTVSWHVLES